MSFILGIAPIGVFASSDSDESGTTTAGVSATDNDRESWTFDPFTNGVLGNNDRGKFPGPIDAFTDKNSYDYYTFAIMLGRLNKANVDSIIFSYYTSPDAKYPYKQVLEVNRDCLGGSDVNDEYGSRARTMADSVGTPFSSPDKTISIIENNKTSYFKHYYDRSLDEALYLVPDIDTTQFKEPYLKIFDKEGNVLPFQANRTEYISFRAQYYVYKVESISFLCSKSSGALNGELEINNWALYETGPNSSVISCNYAFVSNGLGAMIDGQCVLRSTQTTNDKLIDGIVISDNALVTYYAKDQLPSANFDSKTEEYNNNSTYVQLNPATNHPMNSTDAEYKSKNKKIFWEENNYEYVAGSGYKIDADAFRSDTRGSEKQLLCCEHISGSESSKADLNAPVSLNFEIKLADEYGAGIESFNKSPLRSSSISAGSAYDIPVKDTTEEPEDNEGEEEGGNGSGSSQSTVDQKIAAIVALYDESVQAGIKAALDLLKIGQEDYYTYYNMKTEDERLEALSKYIMPDPSVNLANLMTAEELTCLIERVNSTNGTDLVIESLVSPYEYEVSIVLEYVLWQLSVGHEAYTNLLLYGTKDAQIEQLDAVSEALDLPVDGTKLYEMMGIINSGKGAYVADQKTVEEKIDDIVKTVTTEQAINLRFILSQIVKGTEDYDTLFNDYNEEGQIAVLGDLIELYSLDIEPEELLNMIIKVNMEDTSVAVTDTSTNQSHPKSESRLMIEKFINNVVDTNVLIASSLETSQKESIDKVALAAGLPSGFGDLPLDTRKRIVNSTEVVYDSPRNQLNLSDVLHATIVYLDKAGSRNKVTIPVIPNAIMSALVSTDESELAVAEDFYNSMLIKDQFNAGYFLEYAQEGERIVFGMDFPSFSKLESINLTYREAGAENNAQIGIESIAVYSNETRTNKNGYEYFSSTPTRSNYVSATTGKRADRFASGTFDITAKSPNATLDFVSEQSNTIWIANETRDYEIKFKDLRNLDESQRMVPKPDGNYTNQYLVTLKTDRMVAAATSGDVMVQFTYTDIEGKTKETVDYNIREICGNYEGYVDGIFTENTLKNDVAGNRIGYQGDVAYYYGMQPSNEIHFIISLNGVKEFTGAKFTLAGSTDEWQMSNISIKELTSMSERYIVPFDGSYVYSSRSSDGMLEFVMNHAYARTTHGKELYSADVKLLVQNGEGSTLDFVTGNTEGHEELRPSMEDYESARRLPQFMAESDLKFTTAVQNYEVVVHVGKNSQYATGDDSCGSDNLYYFQLQYEDGASSGYVLANKQLAADGFRSGMDESFIITSNKDHGDVVGVTIIPDDISSNANPLDKLCIDSIDVIKKNENAPDKKFVVEQVGWIATAYRDTSEKNTKASRTEFEMAVSLPVAYNAYMLNLEVEIALGAYPDGMEQYVGDMTADLYYETSSGETKSYRGIQVVKLMYEYKNKTAPMGNDGINYVSDEKSMFRENHTDKFIISVEDCKKISRIVFHGDPLESTKLNIKAISVKALKSKGTLVLSEIDGDYERQYNKDSAPILIAELASQPQRAASFIAGGNSTASFYLDSKDIPDFTSENEKTVFDSTIERVPLSAKDTVNMYLYLSEGTPVPANVTGGTNKSNADIEAGFVYSSTTYSSPTQVSTKEFKYKKITENGVTYDVIYKEGMTASNMSIINYVWARSSNDIESFYEVDHAVLQQVRSGVVIDTMIARINGIFTKKNGTTSKSISSMKTSETTQTVTLQLAEGTEAHTLTAGKDDIAVSIIYNTNSIGDDATSLTSPVIFATDNGTTDIRAGSVLTFEFKEYDVKEIVGLKVQTMGDIKAHIGGNGYGGAIIECNEVVTTVDSATGKSTNKQLMTRTFSTKDCDTDLSGRTAPFTVIADTNANNEKSILRRVDLTFTTKSENSIVDSAGTVPIKATLQYRTAGYTSVETVVIDDIRECISSGKAAFGGGESVTTSFLLPGYINMVSIQIEPYDDIAANVATWNLDSITLRAYGVEDKDAHTIKVNYPEKKDANGNQMNYIVEGSPMTFYLYGGSVPKK